MKIKLWPALALLLLLNACSSSKLLLQTGAQAAKDGILVCQKGIDTYTLLSRQQAIDQSQQQVILILSGADFAALKFNDQTASPLAKTIAQRVNAYKSLLAVYQVFGTLAGGTQPADAKTALDALATSYNSISKLPDLSSGVSGAISSAGSAIMTEIQNGAVKKHNQTLYAITKAYLALWNDELPVWEKYLGLVYDQYASQLQSMPSSVFDICKVKAAVTDPYTGDAVILALYRVKQLDAVYQRKQAIEQQLADFGKELTLLSQAHLDLSKDASATTAAAGTLSTLETLLQTK